ncbi:MAG: 30S ribosomal protein S18 [Clostridia bacterium]|nr:30S ribosomal protein S18 [Clostridia bacterium]
MDNNNTERVERTERAERAPQQRHFNRRRKKVCAFCADKIDYIDYKDTARLRKFVSERAKILPRRISGTCAMHQRQLTDAIKRARKVALMPYVGD